MLEPHETNRMTCSRCGWTRIIDHYREYRGTHTTSGEECSGMLNHERVDTRAPDPAWFEIEDPNFTPTWSDET